MDSNHGNAITSEFQEKVAIIDNCDVIILSTIASIIDNDSNDIEPRRYEEELTEDLWIQIFLRLPVKSLVLVTCVCKYWYGLVKDPGFTRQHLQFQKMFSKERGHFLLFQHDNNYKQVNFLLFDEESNSNATSSTPSYRNLLHVSMEVSHCLSIDGPINGLYCLCHQSGRIVIWNPSTNEVGLLPFPEQFLLDRLDRTTYILRSIIGFGIDPMDDEDYKVIFLFSTVIKTSQVYSDYVMLYTTRTNTWRLLDIDLENLCYVIKSLNSTYFCGFYYWKVLCRCTAFVFDMSKEEAFREISTPCEDGEFALHDDHINLFYLDENLNEIDIWVMLEESNWVKKISVRGIQELLYFPLGFWKTEDEMLIENGDCQTVLYNFTTGRIRNVGPRGIFKAYVYYESLVSLSGGITKYKGRPSLLDKIWSFFGE